MGKKNLTKNSKEILDNEDIRLSRIYFTNKIEIVARIMILVAQAIMLGVIIIVSASLAMIATSKLPIPSVFNQFGLADGVFRGFTIVIAIFGIIFSIIFVIPTLIVRNVKVLKKTGIMFLTLGCFFSLILLGLSIISFLYIPVRLNLPGVIMAGVCTIVLFLGSFLLYFGANRHQKQISKALKESFEFTIDVKS